MARITWKGEGDEEGSKKETTWGRMTLKKGEAVETNDADLIRRAQASKYFDVEGAEETPTEVREPSEYKAPSQQSALGAAPKPGEPVRTGDHTSIESGTQKPRMPKV